MKKNTKIERLDIKVDVDKLREEYLTISDDKFENIWNRTDAVLVQRRFHLLFKNEKINKFETTMFPYTFEVATQIASLFDFNSITYRSVQPNTAYSWHRDEHEVSYHIPLITNLGCYFIHDSESWNRSFPKEPIRIITEEDYKHFNEMQNYFRDEN